MPWAAPAVHGDPPAYADLQAAGLLDPGPAAGPAARGSMTPNTTDVGIIPCLSFSFFIIFLLLIIYFLNICTNQVNKIKNIQ